MPRGPEPAAQAAFREADLASRIKLSRVGCWLAIILVPGGLGLDWLGYPDRIGAFALIRGICVAALGAVLVLLRLHPSPRTTVVLGVAWAQLPSLAICSMIALGGGAASPYYMGLVLVLIAVAVVMPWTLAEVVANCLLTLAGYVTACLLGDAPLLPATFGLNLAFLGMVSAVCATGSYAAARLRRQDFHLRWELDERNRQLDDNYRRLAEADRLRSQFVANTSHELRTPLTLILAPLQHLLTSGRDLPREVAEALGLARDNGLRLLKLINDLLELSRLEAGGGGLHRIRVDKAFGGEFSVLTATSVDQAMQVLAKDGARIAVVISDQRMPGATGVELLAWISANRPDIIRILATAFAENEATVAAVNAGQIYRYIQKPWDPKELRQTMLRALDLYELQRERDLLLREKLSTLRRLVVADRVRSYAMLANGLANRIRNSVQALKAFLDYLPPEGQGEEASGQVQWQDLWTMAQRESQRVVDVVQGVIDRTIEPAAGFTAADIAGLAEEAGRATCTDGRAFTCTAAGDLPRVKVDVQRFTRLVGVLAERVRRIDPAGRTALHLERAEVWGAPGVRLCVTSPGTEWSQEQLKACFAAFSPRPVASGPELESDLLAAYFIAFHHGGNLVIHRSRPGGSGFEVLLPEDPDAVRIPEPDPLWTERIFTAYDA